jgi:ABC-type phosphate/phosphonate transport system ATPase subunit
MMDIETDAIVTTDLTKRFGERTAVRAVNLRVPTGTAFGYRGPNGAGKTTPSESCRKSWRVNPLSQYLFLPEAQLKLLAVRHSKLNSDLTLKRAWV